MQVSWRTSRTAHYKEWQECGAVEGITNGVLPESADSLEEGSNVEIHPPLSIRASVTGDLLAFKIALEEEIVLWSELDSGHAHLGRLREAAAAQLEAPTEELYALLLFCYYADLVNNAADRKTELARIALALAEASVFDAVADTLDGKDKAKLTGCEATNARLFWLRMAGAVFSLISFSVMASVPHMEMALFRTRFYCADFTVSGGHYNMRPYHAVIAAGVLSFAHSAYTSVYYLVHTDSMNRKYCFGKIARIYSYRDYFQLLILCVYRW